MTSKVTVLDVETTGVGNRDRIVEIATLTLDVATGEVVDRFETLINPQRDIGPTSIHGISARMVELAPTFGEVAHAVARRVDGSVLVAHNLAFDARFLQNEFERLGGEFDPGNGFCTLRATGMKLAAACEDLGVMLSNAHQAAGDVEATAKLAIKCGLPWENCEPAIAEWRGRENPKRTVVRAAYETEERDVISHLLDYADISFLADRRLIYADALDHALNDHELDADEQASLSQLADLLGLQTEQVARIHRQYLESIITAAQRDGRISDAEHTIITRMMSALGIYDVLVPPVTDTAPAINNLRPTTICFTGEAVIGGHTYTRVHMEAVAALHGITPKNAVSKNCDLVVAADPASNSGKARRARELNIPIIGAAEFLAMFGTGD